nr:MAG TPA: hypothetical protein [Caudoviricetes sp.]
MSIPFNEQFKIICLIYKSFLLSLCVTMFPKINYSSSF